MRKLILITGALLFSLNIAMAQRETRQRIPLIGSQAPAFKAPSTNGLVSFPEDFGKDWKILFAHPRDFTPVCSSEILELAHRQNEFKELGAHIIVISVDRLASHRSWKADLEDVSFRGHSKVKIDFSLVVDSSSVISYSYGMVDPQSMNHQSIRGVFFIDPENRIRAFQFYPNEVGRSTDEIVRLLKALQTQYTHQNTVIPANWQPGDDVMVPILTKEDKEDLKSPNPKVHFINWYMIFRKQE
ncbi:MAG: redoxin domain-containing protein [Bacteroidota bacterium]|nr:redoxin domain-containing protein [Bacteroidota bacterium]